MVNRPASKMTPAQKVDTQTASKRNGSSTVEMATRGARPASCRVLRNRYSLIPFSTIWSYIAFHRPIASTTHRPTATVSRRALISPPVSQHHGGDVVALRGAVRKITHVRKERFQHLLRFDGGISNDAVDDPGVAELVAGGRHRLRDAVAEDDQPVARGQVDGFLVVERAFEQTDDRPSAFEPAHIVSLAADDERRVVTGVAIRQRAARQE